MRWQRQILVLAGIISLVFCTQHSFATSPLEISTSKHVYEYGDYLSINFQVSEITGKDIVLHITDSSNRTSAPIDIPIYKANSTITSPFPFYKIQYNPGTYRIDANYSNTIASTSFELIDSGRIAIPTEIKSLVNTLQQGSPTDKSYAEIIQELINEGIISVPNYTHTDNIHIPQWFKKNFQMWSEDYISDNDFGAAVQYLLQKGIIQV